MIYASSPLIARILNRLHLLNLIRIGYKLKILDKVFKIPIIENKEGFIYHLSIGEPYLLDIFRKLCQNSDIIFLDAGVNFGQTLLKIKAVDTSLTYFGFEPSGLCSYYTNRLIKTNKFINAKLIRCALSDSAGILTLHSHSEGDTRATIMSDHSFTEENIVQELVPALTLDSLIPTISPEGKNIILKVDVEGAEWMVFKGAERLINDFRPVIVFENLPSNENVQMKEQQRSIKTFFSEKKYQLYLLNEKNCRLDKVSTIENENDYSQTNYIAIPEEKMATLKHIFIN